MRFRVRMTAATASVTGARFPLVPLALLSSALVCACAHSDTAADRHIAEMRETIGKVQAEQDRTDQSLEPLEGEAPARPPVPAAASKREAPPRTVQIGDDGEGRESDDPEDPNARPEIRVQGPAGAARPVRGKSVSRRGEARVDPTEDGSRADVSRAPILDPDAKRAYEAALAQVNSKQYDRALEALTAFLVRWPDHPYVENAMYWRGECYFARGEHLRAAEQFEGVLSRFGGGNKAPDALLKIGMCHDRLGASDRAKEYWDRLRRDHPRSDAVKRIPGSSRSETRGSSSSSAGPKENR
jgi:tol-pal system protein YbgF